MALKYHMLFFLVGTLFLQLVKQTSLLLVVDISALELLIKADTFCQLREVLALA
jgi:hypothetical protein